MPTNDQHARIYNKKILPLDVLKTGMLDYLIASERAATKILWNRACLVCNLTNGGIEPSGNNQIKIAEDDDLIGTDGQGKLIRSYVSGVPGDRAHSDLQGVKIPPGTKTYDIALSQFDVDNGIEANPRTGAAEYSTYIELIGYLAAPDSVSAVGTSIKLYVNDAFMMASADDHTGRSVRVWLKSAAEGGIGPVRGVLAENAFQIGTIAHDGGGNYVTIANGCGQSVPTTTASNYRVMLMGPLVTDHSVHPLLGVDGMLFMGHVTSVTAGNPIPTGNIDNVGQSVAPYGIADQSSLVEKYVHDAMMDGGSRDVLVNANGTNVSDLGGDPDPIPALQRVPTIAYGSGFTTIVGAGTAESVLGGEGVGMSTFNEIAWAQATLTHDTPHASKPRIDAIVANAAALPGTLCTLAIVKGTAEDNPQIPTIASNRQALFYVYIPAAVANSSLFGYSRALHRRIEGPFSSFHGILEGVQLEWPVVANSADSIPKLVTTKRNSVIIDGERLEFILKATDLSVEMSASDPPTSNVNYDKPYYIYMCGGRHTPICNKYANPAEDNTISVKMVATTIEPYNGRAISNFTDAAGNTITSAATLFISLGFLNTTGKHKHCSVEGDWIRPEGALVVPFSTFYAESIFSQLEHTVADTNENYTMYGIPAVSTMIDVIASYTPNSGDVLGRVVKVGTGAYANQGTNDHLLGVMYRSGSLGMSTVTKDIMWFNRVCRAPGSGAFCQTGAVAGDVLLVASRGFNMNVKRLSL